MKTGLELIIEERRRQVKIEGWTAEHDATHKKGELADAAACYALADFFRTWYKPGFVKAALLKYWPFNPHWLKLTPNNRVGELAKAGALIAAEIDRLNSEPNVQGSDTTGDEESVAAGTQKKQQIKDKAWDDLGNTLYEMGNEEPEW